MDNLEKNNINILFSIFTRHKLLIIIFIAFILRIYNLGYHDIWYDEAVTIYRLPNFNFLKVWNPPLYYALLAGWVRLFGFSEISLRFPSLLFSLACIPVIFLLGKEILNKSAGLYGALIFALSPFQIWYAQEARAYTMMLFFGLLSTYFQSLFINRTNNKYLFWYTISTAVGIYTHTYYIFFIIVQLMCYLVFYKRHWPKRIFIIPILIILSFLPLLQKYSLRLSWIFKGYWVPVPSWKSFLITIENFFLGYNSHLYTYFIVDALTLILFISAIFFIRRNISQKKGFLLCCIMFLMPMIVTFLFSKLFASVYLDRGLIVSCPYYYLILGLGICTFRSKLVRFILLTFVCLFLSLGIYAFFKDWMPSKLSHHTGVHLKKPIKSLVEFINKNIGPKDIVVFTNDSVVFSFIWYDSDRNPFLYYTYLRKLYSLPHRYRFFFEPNDIYPSYKQPRKENQFNIPIYKTSELKFEKLWVLYCDWPREGTLCENSIKVKEWLDKNFNLEEEFEFDGLWIYKYAR